jgi:cytochrome c-type biogenesis protein
MDTRREMARPGQQGVAGSALMGVVFSAGWTPCIGPVYGAVLTMAMATNSSSVAQAGLLLVVYSLGLGVPFLLTALMLDSAQGVLRRLRSNMRRIEVFSGAFLVLIGIMVASGTLQQLSLQFSGGQFADFSYSVEESVIDLFGAGEAPADPAAEGESLILTNPDTAQTAPPTSAAGALPSIAGLAASSGPEVGLDIGQRAPDFETVTDSGQPIRLADLRGQVVLLNFWATWCGPCRVEMPAFEAAFQAHKDNGFTIVAVNNAEPSAAVQAFRQELGLSFPLVMDTDGAVQRRYGVQMYPSTYLLDASGTIIARHFGALTEAQLADMLDSALAGL